MRKTGFNDESYLQQNTTLMGRFKRFIDNFRIQFYATFAVIASITFVLSEIVPSIQKYIFDNGLLQYLILLFILDISASIFLQKRPLTTHVVKNQDESMPKLIECVKHSKTTGVDLLEYAGATTLPLIREIQREGIPMRLLIKHPDTITGLQKVRMITTLDTLYNSIFDNSNNKFEIRCYRLPYTLRARRIGKEILELGWLTPDKKHHSAYGHANPSVLVDISIKQNDYLLSFFNKTFDDLWNDKDTEDGLVVFNRLSNKE